MTSQVAHELNNTLTALVGWAKHGLKTTSNPQQCEKALQHISASAERAVEICRGLLGLAREGADSGEMLCVSELIDEARTSLSARLDKKGITLHCDCPDGLTVQGKRTELIQMLLNIMLNSCQAMDENGGSLQVLAKQHEQGHGVNISITDTGPGIRSENIQRIFEPFFSTKQSSDVDEHSGTGLGLAICRDIATSHGGAIEVQSVAGRGATFSIFLPNRPS